MKTRRRNAIVCNKCQQSFMQESVVIKTEALTDNREGLFFNSPLCGEKYPFSTITIKGKKLRKDLFEIIEKLKSTKDVKTREGLLTLYASILKDYEKEITGPYKKEEVISNE